MHGAVECKFSCKGEVSYMSIGYSATLNFQSSAFSICSIDFFLLIFFFFKAPIMRKSNECVSLGPLIITFHSHFLFTFSLLYGSYWRSDGSECSGNTMWLSFLFAHCKGAHFSVEVSHYFQEKCGQTHVLPNLLISWILFISQIKKSVIKTEFLKGHIVRFPFDQNGFPVNQTFLSSGGAWQ